MKEDVAMNQKTPEELDNDWKVWVEHEIKLYGIHGIEVYDDDYAYDENEIQQEYDQDNYCQQELDNDWKVWVENETKLYSIHGDHSS
jgi:hypothetical protein